MATESYQLAERWESWKCECRRTELASCEISCSHSVDDKDTWLLWHHATYIRIRAPSSRRNFPPPSSG